MTEMSLVPMMMTITIWLALPSALVAVKLSVSVAPAASCWIAVCALAAL